jgi:hypothetical protein
MVARAPPVGELQKQPPQLCLACQDPTVRPSDRDVASNFCPSPVPAHTSELRVFTLNFIVTLTYERRLFSQTLRMKFYDESVLGSFGAECFVFQFAIQKYED